MEGPEELRTHKQITVAWKEATREQLVMFAAQVLGMQFAPNAGEESIRAKIRSATDAEELAFFVPIERETHGITQVPPAPPSEGEYARPARSMLGTSGRADPRVQLTIPEEDKAGGQRPVFVGVNGVGMLIPRGRIVSIPYRYFLVMQNAVQSRYHRDDGTDAMVETKVPSYPYNVNAMPPAEEIDAWLKQESGELR